MSDGEERRGWTVGIAHVTVAVINRCKTILFVKPHNFSAALQLIQGII